MVVNSRTKRATMSWFRRCTMSIVGERTHCLYSCDTALQQIKNKTWLIGKVTIESFFLYFF